MRPRRLQEAQTGAGGPEDRPKDCPACRQRPNGGWGRRLRGGRGALARKARCRSGRQHDVYALLKGHLCRPGLVAAKSRQSAPASLHPAANISVSSAHVITCSFDYIMLVQLRQSNAMTVSCSSI